MRDKSLDIIFLQETHVTNKTAEMWENEWGSKWFNTTGNSASRGTSILTSSKFTNSITDIIKDENGQFIICTLTVDDKKITLCNLYAPNDDNTDFFNKVFETPCKYNKKHIIIGGDFNLVLDTKSDRLNSNYNHVKSAEIVKNFMEDNQLTDVWHDRHENEKRYTWFKKKPVSASRIDFFLIDVGLANMTTDCNISKSTRTDHALISLKIQDPKTTRGPGVWKLNNLFLSEKKYNEGINSILDMYAKSNIDPICN